ncbi:MAG: hypothetical protein RL238_819 [Actinomycetota bacterium]
MGVRSNPRIRRWTSVVLAAVASLSLAVGLLAAWALSTVFDAGTMSRRAVHALDSEAVRHEVAVQLTDQLVQSGNREIIAFRPAALLTVEALVDTDAFKSIFATAVRRTHSSLIAGDGASGLDLSDSLALLAEGLQLKTEQSAPIGGSSTNSMADVMTTVADLPIWGWRGALSVAAFGALGVGLAAAVGSVLVAADRRKGVVRVGFALSAGGASLVVVIAVASVIAAGFATDPALKTAVQEAVWEAAADLRATGFGLAVMGMVVAAAASPNERFSPDRVREVVTGRYQRLRSSAWGTLLLAGLAAAAGLWIVSDGETATRVAVFMVGLGLVFVSARLVVNVASTMANSVDADGHVVPQRRWLGWGIAVVGVSALVLGFSVVNFNSAKAAAESAAARECLGSEGRCDLRLDEVTLAGTHNSMASPAYAGWLFAEQIDPIGTQLRSGARALLLDAHYGRKSTVKVPGSNVPLVITDIAGEFAVPGAELPDEGIRQRAEELAASAPSSGSGRREVYLCHNYCELGAVKMVDEMVSVRRFLEINPSEIVVIVVQDAVSSADIAAVVEQAGLLDMVATLDPSKPLPTLGELVDSNRRLVMFAERGDDDAPGWYQRAYDHWFQETVYKFDAIKDFTCEPNRGDADNPLFLLNHWVSASPPDPSLAGKANARAVFAQRVTQCRRDRGLTPNVIAVDFSSRGDVVGVANDLTDSR